VEVDVDKLKELRINAGSPSESLRQEPDSHPGPCGR
jgi:hypothetical protein